MNLLTDVVYKSSDTGTEVLSSVKKQDKDLIDLADSDLVTGKIVSYSEDSFMFETSNLMIPNFIVNGFGSGSIIVGLPVNFHAAFPKKIRTKILDEFVKTVNADDRSAYIVDKFSFDELLLNLYKEEKDNVAYILKNFFARALLEAFEVGISFLRDQDNNLYINLETKPRIDVQVVFDEYIQTILYQNRLYKSRLGSEKLCFCPAETPIGDQISSVINTVNEMSEEIRRMMVNDLIGIFEKEFNTFFEEYIQEEQRTTGVIIDGTKISYFKNICNPVGLTALIKDSNSGTFILGNLKEEIEFLPKEMTKEKYSQIFKSTTELEFVSKIA